MSSGMSNCYNNVREGQALALRMGDGFEQTQPPCLIIRSAGACPPRCRVLNVREGQALALRMGERV